MSGLTLGAAVTVEDAAGQRLVGQVWSPGDARGWVWLALDGGRYVLANVRSGVCREKRGGPAVGRITP